MTPKTHFVLLLLALALLGYSLVFRALAEEQTQTLKVAGPKPWILSGQPQARGAQQEQPPQQAGAQPPQQEGTQTKLSAVLQTGVAEGEDHDFEKQEPDSTNQDVFADNKNIFNVYPRVTVDIMNGLPPNSPPLLVHCKSKDDDLGNQTLTRWKTFFWRFKPAVFGTTLFWCRLWWGSKHVKFEVYNENLGEGQCLVGHKEAHDPNYKDTNICHWQSRADGIYFTPFLGLGQHQNDKRWIKKYDWGTENYGPVE